MLLVVGIAALVWAFVATFQLRRIVRLREHYLIELESIASHCWHQLKWDVGSCEYPDCVLGIRWGHHHKCGLGFSRHHWGHGWGIVDEGFFASGPLFIWPAGPAGMETVERRLNGPETVRVRTSGWQPRLDLIDTDRMSSEQSIPVLFGPSGNVFSRTLL